MNCPMARLMKTGIIFAMAFPAAAKGEGPIEADIRRLIEDEYFAAIEITRIRDGNTRKTVGKLLDASHMTVTFGAQPMLLATGSNLNDLDEDNRRKALALLREGIDEAYEMGASAFTVLSGRYPPDRREEAYSRLVRSVGELCRYAGSKGDMKVLLETFDYDVDKKSLIGPASLAKRLADEIGGEHGNFGITVDLSHIPLIHETLEEAVLPVRDHLVHAHIGNCVMKDPSLPGYGDLHPRFGFPNGETDVERLSAFLKLLMDIGFLNETDPPVVSFEVKPFGGEDPEIVIAGSKRALNMAWAKL